MSKRNTFVSKQMQWQLGLVTLINCILLVQVTVFRAYATASETDQSNACNKFNTIRLAVRVFLWTRSSILILPTTGFRYFKMYHVQWATGSLPQDTSGPNIVRTHYLRLCELLALVQIAALLVSTGTIVLRFVQVEWTFTCPTAMDKRIYQICMALSLLVATYCYTISWEFLLSFHKLRTHLLFQHGVFDCKTKSWQEKPFNGSTKELLRFQMWMTVKQRDIDGLRSAIAAAINEDAAFATQWYQSPSIWNQLVCVSRRNPLHMAIKTNQFDMVQLLIQVQVAQFGLRDLYSKVFCFFSINHSEPTRIYGPFGWFKHTLLSPLHVAVARSDHHLVLHLLQAGADPNVSAESNVASAAPPPLFWASHVDVTHALLMHGASQLYVPGNGFNVTVFEDAFLNGRHAIARLLESWGGDIALTPLHDAAGRGDVVKMKAYLGWGDVDTMGEQSNGLFHRTPLHWAAIRGHVNAARMLLKAGAKVNAVDSWHQSPLTWACYLNRTELVYLWSRQLVDFRQAITSTEPALVVNHDVYNTQLTALLDGLRNEVEKRRLVDRRDVLLSPLTVSVRQTEVEFAYHQRYVFICHGGCHTDFVKRLQGMLKLHGIASYADHQVGGTTHDAILNCSAFLPIFSDKSCRTDAFSDLFAFAVNKEKPIVPIVLSANFFPLAHLYSLSLHTSVVHFNEVLAQSESLTRLVAALPVVCPPLACFSQWFEAPFSIDDISYHTAEHFMMAEKARLFHDKETLADILGATDPATAKAYGRSVNNFDEGVWCRHRFDIVVRANTAKFGQNEALKAYLLGTKKHILVEASPRDPIWGIGLSSKNEHAQNPKHWRGLNLLGFALMTVRELLQADECT
ncbi:hypothetical protein B5M09_010135 [Aphanomyces astaci]|uniref:NADAR domain-containing protein n=1 Tax=Aphanomyces astaci TaxID=112090 RepID=A0A425CVY9_APHAT|nr:hypothetical protein B5M09_010135 [Aphanomyces astaci]